MVKVQSQDPYIRIDNQRVYPFSIDRSAIPLLKRPAKSLGRAGMGLKVQELPANKQSKCIKLLQ